MYETKAKQEAYEKNQRMLRLKKHFESSRQAMVFAQKLTLLPETKAYTQDPSKNPQYPLQLITQLLNMPTSNTQVPTLSKAQLLYDIMDISCAINLARLFDNLAGDMAERFLKLLFDPKLEDQYQLSAYCILSNILIDFKDQERLSALTKVLCIKEQLPGFFDCDHLENYKVVFLMVLVHLANRRVIDPTDPQMITFLQRLDSQKLSKILSLDRLRLATVITLADDDLQLKLLPTLEHTIKDAIMFFNNEEKFEDTIIISYLKMLLTLIGLLEDPRQIRQLLERELKLENAINLLSCSSDVQLTALSFLLNSMLAAKAIDDYPVLVALWPTLYRNLIDATYITNAKVKIEAVDCLICLLSLTSPELIEDMKLDTDPLLQAVRELLKWDNTDLSLETMELLCTLLSKDSKLESTIWRNSQLHDEIFRVSNSKNLKLGEVAGDVIDRYFQPRINDK